MIELQSTGMDKAFKAETIYAMSIKLITDKMPGIDPDVAKRLAKINADSLIYSIISHKEFDEIINNLKAQGE